MPRKYVDRIKPPTISEVIEQVWDKRMLTPMLRDEDYKPIGEYGHKTQVNMLAELREAERQSEGRQFPLEGLHRVCRKRKLMYASVYLELPAWIKTWDWVEKPRAVYDNYGRLMFMTKGKKKYDVVMAAEFSPLVRFEPVFPMHPDPMKATQEEKEERMAAFLNMYAASGLPTPSAQAVGVNYMQLLIWLNESEVWQARFIVAKESAKQLLQDVARMRAIQGDSALLTFFVKHDNPEQYGRGVRKNEDGGLPEGVSTESVADALGVIQGAKGALPTGGTLPAGGSPGGSDPMPGAPTLLPGGTLVDQKTDEMYGYVVEPDEDEPPVSAPSFAPRDFGSKTIDIEAR